MKILQVSIVYFPEFEFGGPPRKIHALSRGLQRRGHDVSVATMCARQPRARGSAVIDGVGVRYVPWVGRGNVRVPTSSRELEDGIAWADVVHLYGLFNLLCPLANQQASRMMRATVLEPLGMYLPLVGKTKMKALYNRLFTRRLVRDCRRLIAASSLEAQQFRGLAPEWKIALRPNIVEDIDMPRPDAADAFRERLGITSGFKVILFVGRISPVKNLEVLLKAFDASQQNDAVLLLAGPSLEPAYERRLLRLVATLGSGQRILFPGPLHGQERAEALAAAELFVLPSVFESFGNSAVEAVRAGVPVLLSETCGVAPWLAGRAGLSVPPTVEGLARGIATLLRDGAERARLTAQRDAAVAELSEEKILDLTEQIYGEVLSETN